MDLRLKCHYFRALKHKPHNGDIQKSQALAASRVFFISNLDIVGTSLSLLRIVGLLGT